MQTVTADEKRQESLSRAVQGQSLTNYTAILEGFAAKGIPEAEILPRENVFTFNAWKALGRSVKKGEHGIKILTFIDAKKDDGTTSRRPWTTTVFHISQTEIRDGSEPTAPPQHVQAEPQPQEPRPVVNLMPERLRKLAAQLQPKIDHSGREMTQNPTPKRNREYQSRMIDCRNFERTQRALIALADLHEAGTVPVELASLRTTAEVSQLVRKSFNSTGYYSVVESDDYAEKTPQARMLQALTDPQTAASQERDRLRKLDEELARIKLLDIPGYFPTPAPLAARMVELAELEANQEVLEPSAGTGNICKAILDAGAKVFAVEQNYTLSEYLSKLITPAAERAAGICKNVLQGDFLEQKGNLGTFDRIVMNPPFENRGDIKHILHARRMLKPGGKLVAICANGPRQREELEPLADTWEELPEGTFKQSGTGINTVLLTMTV